MIKLTAKIDLISAAGQDLDRVLCNLPGNNISSNLEAIKGLIRDTRKPFIFGHSKLGEGDTFSSGENYFIGNQLSNSSGTFATPYSIQIEGSRITQFGICFDTAKNIYPTEIKVNGVSYSNNSSLFKVEGLASAATHTVVIEKINKAYSPLVITGIFVDLVENLDYQTLKSIETERFDRADVDKPSWGIFSSTGSISFYDFDKKFLLYSRLGLLKSNLEVKIILSDTLSGINQVVGTFITDKWDYDTRNSLVNVSLQDDLIELQEILISGENRINVSNTSMGYIYNLLYWLTPSKFKFKGLSSLDSDTQWLLINTKGSTVYLNAGSLWGAWQKLAEACMLHIVKDSDGSTACFYHA